MTLKKRLIILLIVVVLGTGGLVAYRTLRVEPISDDTAFLNNNDTAASDEEDAFLEDFLADFGDPVEVPHFVSSTPNHTDTVGVVPVNIVIDTDFDLAAPSSISVINGGTEYGTGETVIDANKNALRRTVRSDAPDGLYAVTYKACWPDASCHEGSFKFEIDRTLAEYYDDQRGKSAVAVTASDLTFDPIEILVSKGTTVTWTNDEETTHSINTDPHPSHSYFPPLNSKTLAKGETYSYTFNEVGYYPYHCSMHPDDMVGTIAVE